MRSGVVGGGDGCLRSDISPYRNVMGEEGVVSK